MPIRGSILLCPLRLSVTAFTERLPRPSSYFAEINTLDHKAVKYIKAVSQAKVADHLIENGLLSDEETAVYKRGRNAKSPTTAKNAPVGDYRKATGLEALIGYLYLKGNMDRVLELMKTAVDFLDS